MDEEELEASQALSQEIDRGFPAIPQSQLDDLIPLEGLDGDDEDKIMALYRTISGPPKETAFTDEQLERYLAEVRRDALLEAAKAVCMYCNNNIDVKIAWEGWYWHYGNGSSLQCAASDILKLAAEQGQSEGDK